jgi:hypothetical protein
MQKAGAPAKLILPGRHPNSTYYVSKNAFCYIRFSSDLLTLHAPACSQVKLGVKWGYNAPFVRYQRGLTRIEKVAPVGIFSEENIMKNDLLMVGMHYFFGRMDRPAKNPVSAP